MYRLIIISLSFLFFTCQNNATQKTIKAQPFFDLKGYFEAEISQLANQKGFKKVTYVNGKKEERKINSLNFEKELIAFKNADLNKISWFDKYTTDSLSDNHHLKILNYQAKDTTLNIQKVSIAFDKNQVNKITIHKKMETLLAEAKQILTYQSDIGYIIENEQFTKTGEHQRIKVEVFFEE